MSIDTAAARWDHRIIRQHLTTERLESYELAAQGNPELAFALYEWNIRASAAAMTTAAMVEVIVRNAMDQQLRRWADQRHRGQSWFDVAPLDQQGRRDLVQARERATRHYRDRELHGKVIAELTLGFWRYLTASRYLTALWTPAIGHAFPLSPSNLTNRRIEVDRSLQKLQYLRNRAAHHEPIHRRNLMDDHDAAVRVTSWISPACSAWVADRSPIPAIVAGRPC
ncbi:hypothetical protein [Kineosporia sp. NBRC 101731]|uniref:hypothetical protein n=1 Tax=Kineosporia sp. NBRC 101731 TaxID=3032199 RepID=UPI0024A2E5EE|nr:hypothetical protein [Kineosporia sp. NBRC 101731]GLY27268.1 hypothetical protein Kisp02_06330 [Kineosporia sp. NBRC 101731]